MTKLSEGTRFGDRYELVHRIASGGMGDVWRATDRLLGRDVAVKVLRPESESDGLGYERFRFEAQAAASLSSPAITSVYDYGEEVDDEGSHRAFIVMELVSGESLDRRVQRSGPLGVRSTLEIVEQVALGLQVAHDRGLVHRDIKPANLLLPTTGSAKLTDFGIARSPGNSPPTRTGPLVGTIQYMAPEQLRGDGATPASDLYSLGAVAYFCLTGQAPFANVEPMAVALAHIHDNPPPLPADVPPQVGGFVLRLLAKDPARRPASAAAVRAEASALQASLGGGHVPATPEPAGVEVPNYGSGDTGLLPPPLDPGAGDPTEGDREGTAILGSSAMPVLAGAGIEAHRRRRLWTLVATLVVLVVAGAAVWLSLGPSPVTLPDLKGMTAVAATARLHQIGLDARVDPVDVDQPAGRVVSQVPRRGSSLRPGSRVLLRTASGFVDVSGTRFQGQPVAQVLATLASLGVEPIQSGTTSNATPGTVVAIAPSGRMRLGATVTVAYAVPPPPPTTTTTQPSVPASKAPSHKKPAKGGDH